MATPTEGSSAGTNMDEFTASLANVFQKNQLGQLTNERMVEMFSRGDLGAKITELAKKGQLSPEQINQIKQWATQMAAKKAAEKQATAGPQNAAAGPSKPATAPAGAFYNSGSEAFMSQGVPASSTAPPALSVTDPGPATWTNTQQGRPTLTGGIAGGRMSGTPAQVGRQPDDPSTLNFEDVTRARKKNTPADQSLRKSIQDLVASVDPTVKIDAEVEELLLNVADEFIDSVTNFGCRLAKHRGGDTLEVRDLQLHLERNHNIRIPGFATDESRISLSQASVAPVVTQAAATKKSAAGSSGMTTRSARLAQVQQAKRDAKLI